MGRRKASGLESTEQKGECRTIGRATDDQGAECPGAHREPRGHLRGQEGFRQPGWRRVT